MSRLLFYFAILQIAHCSCPDGFDIVNGQCRGFYASMKIVDSSAPQSAIQKCGEFGLQPVIIHDDEQQSYWTNQTRISQFGLVLGLLCDTSANKWTWSDGSELDYKPKSHDKDLDHNSCKNGCVWFQQPDGAWVDWCDGNTEPLDIFCMGSMKPPPVIPTNGCSSFEEDSDDGICYFVGDTAENWQDAQMNCKKLGGNLASIHNANENSFIRRLAVSNGAVEGVFIGATVSGKGCNFGWIDGSDWDYTNYYSGFPKSGFGDCLAMDTSTSAGQWMNTECSAQLPVACSRDKRFVERNITCSADTYLDWGQIITSPGFPFDASMPCEYYLKVAVGKRVEVEIFLEANSCCDFLVVHDGYIGDVILANLTGSHRNATFTTTSANIMKVQWQPNGGVNVRGMALMFRGV